MKKLFLNILFLGFALALASCSDDGYSSSSSLRLSFSTEELALDTVFATTSSATYDFWVYNRTPYHLRLQSVSLRRGNQSGFRANVDGVPLGVANGYRTGSMEVRSGDSIRVFVDFLPRSTGNVDPVEVSDNLDFTLESGVVQNMPISAKSWDAEILNNVTADHNLVLCAAKPILVMGKLTVAEGATLTLQPGATLYFADGATLDVHGTLLSQGEPGREVTLRGSRLDRLFTYLPYDRVSGQWGGVRIHATSHGNSLQHTDIHGACHGMVVEGGNPDVRSVEMNAVSVHNCQGHALMGVNANMKIDNCVFTNALANCVLVDGGRVEMNGCTLAQFYPFDSRREAALSLLQETATLEFVCNNTLITGYGQNELAIGEADNKSGIAFRHCLIRTSEADMPKDVVAENVIYEDAKNADEGGKHHFVVFDTDNFVYDFHIVGESAACKAADKTTSTVTDRDGTARGEKPNIGAYESKE